MSLSELSLLALLEGCILLSLNISQENVSYETKMAGYFSSIYSLFHLSNKDLSWAQGHLARVHFPVPFDVTCSHVTIFWSIMYEWKC